MSKDFASEKSASDYLTTREVAARLGVTVRQVHRLARQGRIPHIRRGRLIRVPVAAWEAWLAQQSREALAVVKGNEVKGDGANGEGS